MILAVALGSALIGFVVGCYATNRIAEQTMVRMERGFLALIGLYSKKEVMSIIDGRAPTQ